MAGLVTGEAVPLDLRPARLPSRLLAALLDGSALLVLLVGGGVLLSRVALDLDEAAGAAVAVVLFLAVVVGWPTVWEVLTGGRSPGKMAVGLRVVRDDGGPVRFRQSLTRALTLLVDLPTLYLPSLAVQVLSERGKRLGDVLAGTFVVQERVPAAAAASAALPMPPPLAGWAAGLDLSRLPDDLALTVRQFVARAPGLTPAAREDIGARLAAAVAATTAPPPPPGTPGWAYLAAVLAERRRRAELRAVPAPAAAWSPSPSAAPAAPSSVAPAAALPAAAPSAPTRPPAAPLPAPAPPDPAPEPARTPGGFALPG